MKVLLTGGAGYIGSHTLIELVKAGLSPIVIDNLSNSNTESIRRVEKIIGATIPFYELDLRDKASVAKVFAEHTIDAVIHFAGLKAVGESVQKPLYYYQNNLDSTLTLLDVMTAHNVKRLVFSSSATVYGSAPIPYTESYPAGRDITSPYGKTKYMIEEIMRDISASNDTLEFTALRYFNPVGAHESGMIGEDPKGTPNNLMPFVSQVAAGKREKLSVFGNDYDTPDGTCIRDYIHVTDVASGHVAAITHSKPGFHMYNLGSGKGISVIELINAFIESTGVDIPYGFAPRREGDLPEYYADATLAAKELDWHTVKSIHDACRDSWNWQSKNPDGYDTTRLS